MRSTGGWHWGAFILGPIWYLINGLTTKGLWLIALCLFTFFLAVPFVMFYCGAKFKGDLYNHNL